MFEEVGGQPIRAALAAGDTTAARLGMEALLDEALDDLVPADEQRRAETGDFSGERNHATQRLFLPFINNRPAARAAVYELDRLRVNVGDAPDLLRLLTQNRSPRLAIREALLAADFLAWLASPSGKRRLLHFAKYLKHKIHMNIDLCAKDAAAEANLRLLRNLPTSQGYLICNAP